nr:hypothetical protein [Tanacetum cinerariifolium]
HRKRLFGPNDGKGEKVEVGFDNFEGGGEEIRNCDGNGGRGSSIFGRGGGSLAICSMESKDRLGGGGLVVVGGRSSSVSKIAWREVGGVKNKSSMGSMLIAKGKECLDGWVRAGGGEVKCGGVDFGVTKSLLGETPGESGGEEFGVDGGHRKRLFGPNDEKGGKVEVGFDNFEGGGEEIRNCAGNGGRGSSIFGRGGGGVENKSSMGSMLIAKGKECLDGWVRAGGGEVKCGGVDFGVTKSLLGETPGESGGEEIRVDGGVV